MIEIFNDKVFVFKFQLVLSGLLAVVSGARYARQQPIYRDELPPLPPDTVVTPIPIISYNFQPNNGDGNYAWRYAVQIEI